MYCGRDGDQPFILDQLDVGLSDGRSIDTYRYFPVLISIDTFFWYRYLLLDTLVFRFA